MCAKIASRDKRTMMAALRHLANHALLTPMAHPLVASLSLNDNLVSSSLRLDVTGDLKTAISGLRTSICESQPDRNLD